MTRFSLEGSLPYLLVPVLVYLGLLLLLYLFQSRLLYYPDLPSRSISATPRDLGLEYRSIEIVSEDGVRLHGWYLPHANPRATLLLCHGNAGNISHRLDTLQIFNRLGLAVLIFDYRGYGLSEGRTTEAGTYLDAEAAWRYLRQELDIPARQILLFGRSLGAAVAADLATRHRAKGVILESGFTSVPDLASSLYPFFPARWLSRFRYDTRKALESIDYPVLIAHSREDEIIPFAHGERLYRAASEPKQFLPLTGGHNDGFLTSGDAYLRGLEHFLQSLEHEPGD